MIRATRTWAPANLALVKYWGKRDALRNLPATSSLSATLGLLGSEASVTPWGADVLDVQGDPRRSQRVIEAARDLTGLRDPLRVVIRNTVPTAIGLASSASSMAALALALSRALGFEDDPLRIAHLARLGSGSAVRSLHGGFVEWVAGVAQDGSDCVARSGFPASRLPLAIRVAVTTDAPKPVSSGDAMERCRLTSPCYGDFVRDNLEAMELARWALADGDLFRLGRVAEEQSLRLHEMLRAATPSLDLLLPASRDVVDVVHRLRERGVPCFFTIDAGPSVAVFVEDIHADAVGSALAAIPGVLRVLEDRVAEGGARFLGEAP